MASTIDPKTLEALIKVSGIARPGRIEWDLEHFLIESESFGMQITKAPAPEKAAPKPAEQDLVDFLKKYQQEKQISVRTLAQEIGVSRTTLQTFLAGERVAQSKIMTRIRIFKNKIEQSKSI